MRPYTYVTKAVEASKELYNILLFSLFSNVYHSNSPSLRLVYTCMPGRRSSRLFEDKLIEELERQKVQLNGSLCIQHYVI
jgi:hypothetical protein